MRSSAESVLYYAITAKVSTIEVLLLLLYHNTINDDLRAGSFRLLADLGCWLCEYDSCTWHYSSAAASAVLLSRTYEGNLDYCVLSLTFALHFLDPRHPVAQACSFGQSVLTLCRG